MQAVPQGNAGLAKGTNKKNKMQAESEAKMETDFQNFQQRLDRLVEEALLVEISKATVDDFYAGMLANFEDDEDLADEELAALEGNVGLLRTMLVASDALENQRWEEAA